MKRFVIAALFGFFLINVSLVNGDTSMIENGKKVKFDYVLTVQGQIVDTSEGKEPLEYVHGNKMIIPGLEKELEGLKAGDEASVTVSPEEGYGPVDKDAVKEVPRNLLQGQGIPEKGAMIQISDNQGNTFPATIVDVKEESLVLDFNHPLAGQELNFKITIVSVE